AGIIVLLAVEISGRGKGPVVTVVQVDREELRSTVTSNGKVEPVAPQVARAEFPTFVSSIRATEGQSVRRGEVILTLDAADMRAQLSQARAALLNAQTDLSYAQKGGAPDELAQLNGDLEKARLQVADLERSRKALTQLAAQQAATQDELAQNQVALAEARANLQTLQEKKTHLNAKAGGDAQHATLRVQEAQDQVAALGEKVRSATVIAASDGTLYSLPVKQGDYVNTGDVLAEMADLRQVRVRAFVDEPDLGALLPSQPVEIEWDARPTQVWKGKVEQVPKQVVPRGARSVGEVLCSADNDNLELLPNVNVSVHILVSDRPGALAVPRAAVRYDNGQHYVYLFSDGVLHRRNISVGAASAVKYEVLSGLNLGDRVALPGETELQDGMQVQGVEVP
ncbi:MAG: efflux RND transporter periplasmic adaptor subunit, partial [Candidatus Acidiferrales bacterium]